MYSEILEYEQLKVYSGGRVPAVDINRIMTRMWMVMTIMTTKTMMMIKPLICLICLTLLNLTLSC